MATPSNREPSELTKGTIEELYRRMEKPMFNVVYRQLWDAHEAQDVVQEVFLQLWRNRRSVRIETASAWLYRSALNLASNRRRFARLRRLVGLESAEDAAPRASLDEVIEQGQRATRLRAAVEALPEKLRRALLLTELSEMSHAEVGRVLGIPSGTVASRRHLAMRRLGAMLGDSE
jgi:RNA polymerase sigma-70 factor (ECF subfamily)